MTAWSDGVPTGCGAKRSHRSSGVILSTSLTPLLLAASESDSGFHAPTIADFFPPAVLFAGTPFEINRIVLVRFIAAIALVLIVSLTARRAKVVPGRTQAAVEFVLDFVRKNIAIEVLGEKLGRQYFPMLATIFCTVLFMNITGIVPFLNIAGSSVIGLPLVLALWVYGTYLWAGVKAHHGIAGFLKSSLLPAGVPAPLYILLVPIEFLQVFVLRPATLAVRLLANMVAGHLMLAICFVATSYFFFTSDGSMKLFGAGTLIAGFLFFLFEAFVAALQAYVFAILTAVYINLSVEEH
ncbi:F0F1 ATP synthase subunit A [Xylanimonas sp. McL0601]|uniref:F0F1 ATP synthase subunit A n=1 Tax=Xylanimonas sp. McL0601 TaxID=3414739 RepID=UPI003CEB47BF